MDKAFRIEGQAFDTDILGVELTAILLHEEGALFCLNVVDLDVVPRRQALVVLIEKFCAR